VFVFIAFFQSSRTNNSTNVLLETCHYEVSVVAAYQTVSQSSAQK
jgi:hypothetical protein